MRQEIINSLMKCMNVIGKPQIKKILLPMIHDTLKKILDPKAEGSEGGPKYDYANFKEGIAKSICEIIYLLDEKEVVNEAIPVLIQLMKDDSSSVKIHTVEGFVKISKVIGSEIYDDKLIECFNDLIKENSWRLRLSVFKLIADIGANFG